MVFTPLQDLYILPWKIPQQARLCPHGFNRRYNPQVKVFHSIIGQY